MNAAPRDDNCAACRRVVVHRGHKYADGLCDECLNAAYLRVKAENKRLRAFLSGEQERLFDET